MGVYIGFPYFGKLPYICICIYVYIIIYVDIGDMFNFGCGRVFNMSVQGVRILV